MFNDPLEENQFQCAEIPNKLSEIALFMTFIDLKDGQGNTDGTQQVSQMKRF